MEQVYSTDDLLRVEGNRLIIGTYKIEDQEIVSYFADVKPEELQSRFETALKVGVISLRTIGLTQKIDYIQKEKWFDDFLELMSSITSVNQPRRGAYGGFSSSISKPMPEDLKDKSVEDLCEEFAEFIRNEFPMAGVDNKIFFVAKRAFWENKRVDRFYADSETSLLMEKVELLIKQRLTAQQLEEEKERLPDLIDGCLEWARECGFRKLKKMNLSPFLALKGESFSKTGQDILLHEVNLRLQQD